MHTMIYREAVSLPDVRTRTAITYTIKAVIIFTSMNAMNIYIYIYIYICNINNIAIAYNMNACLPSKNQRRYVRFTHCVQCLNELAHLAQQLLSAFHSSG